MANLDDLTKRLGLLEEAIVAEAPKIATEMAQNGYAIAIRRVQKEGIPGKSYSTKAMLATENMFNRKDKFKPTPIATELGRDQSGNLVKGGVRNKGGQINKKSAKPRVMWIKFPKAKKAVPVMVLDGGYKELRDLNGLNTRFVDVTFTGRMLQNVKILRSENEALKFTAIVGVDNKENKGKLAGNRARFGPFLDPTEKEQPILDDIAANRIESLIKKFLG